MKRTHIFIPEPILNRLKELSKTGDVSVAELIRRAIEAFLKNHK